MLPLREPEARVFAQRLASRAILDAHANRTHQPEVPWEAAVLRPPARYARGRQSVRVVRPPLPEAVRIYRQTLPTRVTPLGSFRLQIGGGYRGGLVEGGSFHVIDQLALAAPDVDLLISVPEEYLEVTRWLAEHRWPRPGRVTLVLEPDAIAPWTQDNGKAGIVWGPEDQPV